MSDVHQGLPVLGYSDQPTNKVEIVNANKIIEEQLLRRLDELSALSQVADFDPRWLSVARTHFEEGFMAMNRAVFRPKRIDI